MPFAIAIAVPSVGGLLFNWIVQRVKHYKL